MSTDPVKHLKPGRSIEIEVPGLSNPLRTLVECEVVDNRFRILAPIVEGRTFLFSGVTEIFVIYTSRKGSDTQSNQIKCRIVSKTVIEKLPVITLEIIGEPTTTQRRSAFRVNITREFVFEDRDGVYRMMTSRDISLTGMFAVTQKPVHSGDVIRIVWDTENEDGSLDDRELLQRLFKRDEPENTCDLEVDIDFKDVDPELYEKHRKLVEEKERYFIVEAKVVGTSFDSAGRMHALRLSFGEIEERRSKAILSYLYKKQAEVLSSDPDFANRMDTFFSNVKAESPVPMYISVMSMIAALAMLLAVVFFSLAKPTDAAFMDALLQVNRQSQAVWKLQELRVSLLMAGSAVLFELISFGLRVSLWVRRVNTFKAMWAIRPIAYFLGGILLLTASKGALWQ